MPNYITPAVFLQTLFPPDMLMASELPVIAHPASFTSKTTGERVDYYRQMHYQRRTAIPRGEATYFCVSTCRAQDTRQVKKALDDVRTAMVLVVDDVGTKSTAPAVPPSYRLETSPGNFQWGYLLDPFDVAEPQGQAVYDAFLYSLAQAGLNDPGFRSASRLARLPRSLHRTGFISRVTAWDVDRVWSFDELVGAFDIPMVTPRESYALKPGKYTALADVDDGVYQWLVAQGGVLGHNESWVFITCPWRSSHTDGAQGPSSTAYSPADYGRAGVGFKCLHGHCAGRDTAEFLDAMRQLGARI